MGSGQEGTGTGIDRGQAMSSPGCDTRAGASWVLLDKAGQSSYNASLGEV